ncbi:MAG: FtsX-like permease family protein [Lachnospiraceae bacterium]|nr:FtsX-like permease family protein [Lachnospiraceae bacterium]
MLRFMFQKLMHKKGLVFSLLIGNILLIAVAASHSMYKSSSLQRMLTDEFAQVVEETNEHPLMVTLTYSVKKLVPTTPFWETKQLAENLCDIFGLPEEILVSNYFFSGATMSQLGRNDSIGEKTIQLSSLTDLENHIEIVTGRLYNKELDENGCFEAVISESALIKLNLLVGETLEFLQITDRNNNPIKVKIVGVFRNSSDTDPYWEKSPSEYNIACFVDSDLFYEHFLKPIEDGSESDYFLNATWYVQMDYRALTSDMSDHIINKTNELVAAYPVTAASQVSLEVTDHCKILEAFKLTETKISATLIILEVPVLALLCAFLFMISTQLIQLEENEISQLKSRGASRFQIFRLYLMQSTLLALLGIAGGVPLGGFICQALGSANAFLEFVQRTPLKIHYFDKEVIIFIVSAALLSVIMTVLPAFKHSKLSIIDTKQKKTRRPKPIWQKLFLDVIMLGVSLYGYYTFNKQRDDLYLKVLSGESMDPLLFLSSSLFILGLGLFCLRIQPLLVKLIYAIGKKFWKPANFASLLQIIRTGSKQYFIMAFMIFTVSLGIFFATVARTILTNAENNTSYALGADLIIKEKWADNSLLVESSDRNMELVYYEPDINKYLKLPEIESLAQVLRMNVNFRNKENVRTPVEMTAINTQDFGNTIYMPDNLLVTHINNYLNVLSQSPNGILVSENFKTILGYNLGDSIDISGSGNSMRVQILGFFDYWPGYIPETILYNADGSPTTQNNFLIVANWGTILEKWTLAPYELWIRTNGDTDFIYDFIAEDGAKYTRFDDLSADIVEIHNETLFQGTNGILTMSFIVILILFAIGFLIYWILSIKSRELLFGVLRAMGMSRSEIIHMLINEQIFTGLFSIALGCVIGFVVSELFVPLIQISYSINNQVLPLELVTSSSDMVKLFAIIGITLVICMAILTRIVFSMKITQALKLGED